MKNKELSQERKIYLNNIKRQNFLVVLTQIIILIGFIGIWEFLANKEIIDSFITSKPSRIFNTFINLQSNDLLVHIGVTAYETLVGFLLGTILGIIIAIVLWWSKFLERVIDPFLVVLNSLPKVALRTNYNFMGWSRYSCNYCYGNGNCDGTLMTTNSDETINALNTARKYYSLDGEVMANLFSKIKENKKVNKNIELKVGRQPKELSTIELKDFAEQMIYFRKLLGYTQKQVGKALGVSEDTYRRYELREIEITDIKKIEKIIKVLEFTEKPKVSEYVEFLMSNPEKKLIEFLKNNKISKTSFAQRAGISRRSILEWINKEKSISKESFYKIKKFMEEFEKERLYNENINEEEYEMD